MNTNVPPRSPFLLVATDERTVDQVVSELVPTSADSSLWPLFAMVAGVTFPGAGLAVNLVRDIGRTRGKGKDKRELAQKYLAGVLDIVEFMKIDRQEYDFPPGHPVPGGLYRTHPLPSKGNHYTPVEQYDRLLYAEREAELLKLLIDLGACHIEIIEMRDHNAEAAAHGSASAATIGKADAGGSLSSTHFTRSSRVFELAGATSADIDESEHQWLPYEPSWRTLVHARTIGKCHSATIDLSQDTSFSASSSLAIADDLLGGTEDVASADVGIRLGRRTRKVYRFVVSFVAGRSKPDLEST